MKPIPLEPSKVENIVMASVVLHNLLRSKSETRKVYTPPGSLDWEDELTNEVHEGEWRKDDEPEGLIPLNTIQHGKQPYTAKECRDQL